ncbi:MAG: hypothetical protein MI863_04285 [Desulfobacterales bacterium]|nr:hypothetical protein [Desulfobacterales bacterium]
MSLITSTSVYTSGNQYLPASETQSASTTTPAADETEKEEAPKNTGGVQVSLSEGVADARVRENMGLNPTGPLQLGDFKSAADTQEKIVQSRLEEAIATLGIDPDQQISLSVDSEFNITIAESFTGKSDLEKALNEDPEFELAFKQMSANREIVNYADSLTSRNASLVNFMGDDSSWDDILSMAKKYDSLKSTDASLTSLLGLSKTETPYTYTHNADAQAA